jgi:polar amino acid transport system substrate-binding protein
MQQISRLCAVMTALIVALLLPLGAAAQTLEAIQTAGVLKIGYVSDAAPFSSKDASGQPAGYSIELCQRIVGAIKSKLAMPALPVSYQPTSVSDGLDQVANGSIELLCGSATDTLQRRERVAFSLPIYTSGVGVVLHKNAPQTLVRVLEGKVAHTGPTWRATINQGLANHTYAVHAGTVTEAWVRERVATLGVVATVITVQTHEAGIDLVESNKADAYFADRAILVQDIQKDPDLMVLDRYFTFEPIALVLPRNDDDFRLLVDTTLSKLYRSDDFEPLYAQYFGKPGEVTLTLFKAFARQ